jgi:hypothetical protein
LRGEKRAGARKKNRNRQAQARHRRQCPTQPAECRTQCCVGNQAPAMIGRERGTGQAHRPGAHSRQSLGHHEGPAHRRAMEKSARQAREEQRRCQAERAVGDRKREMDRMVEQLVCLRLRSGRGGEYRQMRAKERTQDGRHFPRTNFAGRAVECDRCSFVPREKDSAWNMRWIGIVPSGARREHSIAELCRREGIAESTHDAWSKAF